MIAVSFSARNFDGLNKISFCFKKFRIGTTRKILFEKLKILFTLGISVQIYGGVLFVLYKN